VKYLVIFLAVLLWNYLTPSLSFIPYVLVPETTAPTVMLCFSQSSASAHTLCCKSVYHG